MLFTVQKYFNSFDVRNLADFRINFTCLSYHNFIKVKFDYLFKADFKLKLTDFSQSNFVKTHKN